MRAMSVRPWRDIVRRQSRQIMVGSVPVGGGAPVTVQTMTNTPTSDAKATIDQIRRCEEAGADIVRVSCPDAESTAALKQIVRAARVPIVADIHFHYKRALEAADAGAACLRINPGNIGSAERVREVVNAAKANGCSMRIGVNAGSLERDLLEKYGEPCPEALVESALDHIRILEEHDFREYKVAVKASDVFLAVAFIFIRRALDTSPQLRIDASGIWSRQYSDAIVPWDQILGGSIHKMRNQTILSFHLKDPDAHPSKNAFTRATSSIDRAFGWGQMGINASFLTGGPQGVVNAVRHFRPDLFG